MARSRRCASTPRARRWTTIAAPPTMESGDGRRRAGGHRHVAARGLEAAGRRRGVRHRALHGVRLGRERGGPPGPPVPAVRIVMARARPASSRDTDRADPARSTTRHELDADQETRGLSAAIDVGDAAPQLERLVERQHELEHRQRRAYSISSPCRCCSSSARRTSIARAVAASRGRSACSAPAGGCRRPPPRFPRADRTAARRFRQAPCKSSPARYSGAVRRLRSRRFR